MSDVRKNFARRRLAAALLVCGLAGCSASETEEHHSGPGSHTPAAVVSDGIELIAVDRAAYDRVVAERRGQVVLVDFWATWCLPCVQQFPHTVELAERFADRGLAVVTVSLDEPSESAAVVEFLQSRTAGKLTNLVSRFGGSPRSAEAFEIPGGALPHYKLYDRTGKLRRMFALDPSAERQFTVDDVDAAVQVLLGE